MENKNYSLVRLFFVAFIAARHPKKRHIHGAHAAAPRHQHVSSIVIDVITIPGSTYLVQVPGTGKYSLVQQPDNRKSEEMRRWAEFEQMNGEHGEDELRTIILLKCLLLLEQCVCVCMVDIRIISRRSIDHDTSFRFDRGDCGAGVFFWFHCDDPSRSNVSLVLAPSLIESSFPKSGCGPVWLSFVVS